jgi:dTDP-glucose pyrophosphorylase
MKYFLLVLFFVALFGSVFGQTSSDTLIQKQSLQVAIKMRDSLNLSSGQSDALLHANKFIYQKKVEARQLYGTDRQVIGRKLQEAENMRDSLYAQILMPEQFTRYKLRKGELTRTTN